MINILNTFHSTFGVGRSMFDVRCSTFVRDRETVGENRFLAADLAGHALANGAKESCCRGSISIAFEIVTLMGQRRAERQNVR